MVSVHTTVTVQAFNGFVHEMVDACFLCVYPKGGGARQKTCVSLRGKDVRTRTPGEDTYSC